MNDQQRRLFLAGNAGKWAWRTGAGVLVARALGDGRNRYREKPAFLIQFYPYDRVAARYRQVVKLVDAEVYSQPEAELLLAELVELDVAGVCARWELTLPASEPGAPLASPIYTTRSGGLSWHWARDDALYGAVLSFGWRRTMPSLLVARRPYDLSTRWGLLWHSAASYPIEQAKADFAFVVDDFEGFLMAGLL